MNRFSVVSLRVFGSCALALYALCANADLRYTVKHTAQCNQIEVSVVFEMKANRETLQMPRWMPGYYVLEDYGTRVKDFALTSLVDGTVKVTTVDNHTWRLDGAKGCVVKATYKMPVEFDGRVGHYSGAQTYVYLVGRKGEKCLLHLDLPSGTKVATGLNGVGNDYVASDYDVLADNSVTFGDFKSASYWAAGKKHDVVVRGTGESEIDLGALVSECKMISDIETDYFGGAPYSKYVWQIDSHVGEGPSYGIEHLSSAEICMSTQVNAGMSGLLAHEYLHLWNVKRIRSKGLGPFNYTQLPKTGALWWLEGVTDYLTQSLLRRYGRTTDIEFFNDIEGNLRGLEMSSGYLKVSPYDSSLRLDETEGGRGNSNGFGMSYYECGFLIGLCLDIELMSSTDGRRSLDDVERALWKLCRDGRPGFEEGEIRKQLILVGGSKFGHLYDRWVMKPGKLPVASALALVGLKLAGGSDKSFRIYAADTVTPHQIALRNIWLAKRRPK
jgi:predicted metalloprotease with PDZ domain